MSIVKEEGEEKESKIYQHYFTIKDALVVIKCVFFKNGGMSDGVVKSITKLGSTLDKIINTGGRQTTIYKFFSNQDKQNED